jgi:tetratricopeptide (TPR) repeat protein
MDCIKIRFSIFIILYLLVFNSLLTPLAGQTSRFRRKVDKSTILFQFQSHLFTQLNSKLQEFQQAFEDDYQAEEHVFDAFEAFKKADPAYEAILQQWVKTYPSLYVPYVARSEYYCACAIQARGNKRIIDKDQNEYKEMERYYDLALLDNAEALRLNVRLDICYAMQIDIGLAMEKEDLIANALAEAAKYHPYAYRVKLEYLQTLTPRNGGSYEKMEGFLASCAKLSVYNPKIKELSASIPADKGSTFYFLGKYDQAVKMYTEALKVSNHHSYYAARGDAYTQLQNYNLAMADYGQALEQSPNDPEYLRRKTQSLKNKSHFLDTQKMKRQTEEPDPYDDWPPKKTSASERTQALDHAQKANDFLNAGQFEKAIPELTEAIRFLPDEYSLYHNRAICYQQMKNDDGALQDFLRAVKIKHDDIEAYVKITFIYANRGSYDEALNAINSVISLKPDFAEGYYHRAKIYESKGMTVEAIQDARRACEMGYQRACREYKTGM